MLTAIAKRATSLEGGRAGFGRHPFGCVTSCVRENKIALARYFRSARHQHWVCLRRGNLARTMGSRHCMAGVGRPPVACCPTSCV